MLCTATPLDVAIQLDLRPLMTAPDMALPGVLPVSLAAALTELARAVHDGAAVPQVLQWDQGTPLNG